MGDDWKKGTLLINQITIKLDHDQTHFRSHGNQFEDEP